MLKYQGPSLKIGWKLMIGIVLMPYLFGWLLLNKNYSVEAKRMTLIWGVFLVFMIVFKPHNKAKAPVDNVESTIQAEAKSTSTKSISNDVFEPYTQKQYPKTFKKFGSRMKDIENARRAAAFLSLYSARCSNVEMSEFSDKSVKSNIMIFVDCRNAETKELERFLFLEKELKDKTGKFFTEETVKGVNPPKTVIEQAFSEDNAVLACQQYVKESAKFPSAVDFSTFGRRFGTSKSDGETWVELEFTALNAMGVELPYKANCNFPLHGKPVASISTR